MKSNLKLSILTKLLEWGWESKVHSKNLSSHAELKSEHASNSVNQGQKRRLKQAFEVWKEYIKIGWTFRNQNTQRTDLFEVQKIWHWEYFPHSWLRLYGMFFTQISTAHKHASAIVQIPSIRHSPLKRRGVSHWRACMRNDASVTIFLVHRGKLWNRESKTEDNPQVTHALVWNVLVNCKSLPILSLFTRISQL